MKLKRVPRKNTGLLPSILTAPPSSTLTGPGGGTGGPGGGAGGPAGGKAGAKAAQGAGQQQQGNGGEAFISRLTSGMAFDFSARDERVYIVGTEDGWVHRCSTSYNEQVRARAWPCARACMRAWVRAPGEGVVHARAGRRHA